MVAKLSHHCMRSESSYAHNHHRSLFGSVLVELVPSLFFSFAMGPKHRDFYRIAQLNLSAKAAQYAETGVMKKGVLKMDLQKKKLPSHKEQIVEYIYRDIDALIVRTPSAFTRLIMVGTPQTALGSQVDTQPLRRDDDGYFSQHRTGSAN